MAVNGFGTHKAIAHAQRGCSNYKYVLKCDVAKYFASIDHEILKPLLNRTRIESLQVIENR